MKKFYLFALLALAVSAAPVVALSHQKTEVVLAQTEYKVLEAKTIPALALVTTARALDVLVPSALADDPVAEPQDPQQAIGLLPQIIDAVKNKNWGLLVSLVLMLLIWLARYFLFPKASPYLAAFLSAFLPCVAMFAASLGSGKPVLESVIAALVIGTSASGLWTWVGKHLLPKVGS